MEAYRIITHTIAAVAVSSVALIANSSFGAVLADTQDNHAELNLSVRQQEQNLGNINENDVKYLESLREHFHLM